MEMLNRAVDGAALFKDMMQKVEAGAAPAEPVDPEVDRKKAEKLASRMRAHDDAMCAEPAKVSQR